MCLTPVFVQTDDSATIRARTRRRSNRLHVASRQRNAMPYHFAHVRKMVTLGSGAARAVEDWKLSRYACYLIVQNGRATCSRDDTRPGRHDARSPSGSREEYSPARTREGKATQG